MEAKRIKSVGCSRSQNVVTIHLQCTSLKASEAVFADVHGAIKRAEDGARVFAFDLSSEQAQPEVAPPLAPDAEPAP